MDLYNGDRWEIGQVPALIGRLVIGDCRQLEVLERAGVQHCQVALIVTTNERVNLEAAQWWLN